MAFHISNESTNEWLNTIENLNNDEHLFITNWVTNNTHIFGIGLNDENKLFKFQTNLQPCLYVWSQNEQILKALLTHLHKYVDSSRAIEKVNLDYKFLNNQTTLIDKFLKNNRYSKSWDLYKIYTTSFKSSKNLHTLLVESPTFSYHIAAFGVWNIECLIMLELFLKYNKDINIYSVYINKNLDILNKDKKSTFNVVVFDIETVSHEDFRLPFGENKTDVINSIVLVDYKNNSDCVMHTIFNLPITNIDEQEKALDMIKNNKKTYKYITKRKCTLVNSEEELLRETFKLLDKQNYYVAIGYNSKTYDMPFLLKRAIFLGMPEMNKFYYKNGIITYGTQMTHIDMYQVISKYYVNELPNFTLKTVSTNLLDSTEKVSFNARYLRYIYKQIEDANSIHDGEFKDYEINLSNMAYYNDMDSLIVLALWLEFQYEDFLLYVTRDYKLPFDRIAQTGVSEYLNNNIIYEGLLRHTICTAHHNTQISYNDKFYVQTNLNKLASSTKLESAGYGGGFNYRDKLEYQKDDVYAMDALAYYPEIISGFNLSHETTLLFTVQELINIIKSNESEVIEMLKKCKIFRFCTHKNINATENINDLDLIDNLSAKLYIFNYNDNGSIINVQDLYSLNNDDRLLIIDNDSLGLLSSLITHRNKIRGIAKNTKKALESQIELCDEIIMDLELNTKGDDDMEIDFDDDDNNIDENEDDGMEIDFDDDGADDDTTSKVFDINNYTIKKSPSEREEMYIVKSHYELLNKNDFMKFENPIECVKEYQNYIKNDYIRVNCHYRNMKIVNSSIYGLLGSQYGILKGKNIAAAATMIGRKYIIEAAKFGHEINCRLVYSDTDSVFFSIKNSTHPKPIRYIQDSINSLNSRIILNAKLYSNIFIMAKKKYIAQSGGIFSRGINKHGPVLWNQKLYEFYEKYICNDVDVYMSDVKNIFKNMFKDTYEQLKLDKTLILCTMYIKNDGDYKTQTPAKKLIDRITKEVPSYKFDNKITYFHIFKNNPHNAEFGLDFELDKFDLKKLNLYKFYSSIIKTLFTILSQAINITNKKRGIFVKCKDLKKLCLLAFIEANLDL